MHSPAVVSDGAGEAIERVGDALVDKRFITLDKGSGARNISAENDSEFSSCAR